MFEDPTLQKILAAAVAALVTWLATSGKRTIANLGKTQFEIKQAAHARAMRDLEAARATDDPRDDVAAAALARDAQDALDNAQRLKAIADGFGNESRT